MPNMRTCTPPHLGVLRDGRVSTGPWELATRREGKRTYDHGGPRVELAALLAHILKQLLDVVQSALVDTVPTARELGPRQRWWRPRPPAAARRVEPVEENGTAQRVALVVDGDLVHAIWEAFGKDEGVGYGGEQREQESSGPQSM